MKINILILFVLLTLGIGNTLAEPPQTQQQIIKLQEDEINKIYHDLDEKLNDKVKSYIQPYLIAMGAVIGLLVTLSAFNLFSSLKFSDTTEKEIKRISEDAERDTKRISEDAQKNIQRISDEIDKTIREKVKETVNASVDTAKKDIIEKFNERLTKGIEIIDKTIALAEDKRKLSIIVIDIDTPSINHAVTEKAKSQIKRCLKSIHDLQQEIDSYFGRDNDSPYPDGFDIADTASNNEIAGKAHHYLAEHKEAIIRLKEALNKNHYELNLCQEIYLFLGYCHAGLGEYKTALEQYEKVTDQSMPQVYISKGDAYKGMVDYDNAIKQFKKAEDIFEDRTDDSRYYWESLYGQATSLVALGRYGEAMSIYNKFDYDAYKKAMPERFQMWVNVSKGDCYRKWGGKDDYNQSEELYKLVLQITSGRKEFEDIESETHYKIGRLYIDMEDHKAANIHFSKVIEADNKERFELFWGYSLIKNFQEDKGKKKIQNAIDILQKKVEECNSKELENYEYCYLYYNLAMGFAMQSETKGKAIEKLNTLITGYSFDFIKNWAKSSNYSDFIEIRSTSEFLKLVG